MNADRRKALIAKIQGLRAKTTASGCTEAEALLAAAKADELMRSYDIDLTEAEVRDETIGYCLHVISTNNHRHPASHACMGVDHYCDVRTRYCGHDKKNAIWVLTIYGAPADRELACYFYDLIRTAINCDYMEWRMRTARPQKQADFRAFGAGMASRISDRLYEMKHARSEAVGATGTALVVVKRALVDAAAGKVEYVRGKPFKSAGAFVAGRAAGDRVALHTGIGQQHSAPVARIGR
jgi:hypothetical protein